MINLIVRLQMWIIGLQFIFIVLFNNYFDFITLSFALILYIIFLLIQRKFFENDFRIVLQFESPFGLRLLVIVFLLLVFFQLKQFVVMDKFKTLNALQGTEYIGLITKNASTLLPAISFSLFFTSLRNSFKIFIISISFVISLVTSVFILSKMPIVPYVLFFILVFDFNKKGKNIYLFFVVLFLIISLILIYSIRGNEFIEIPRLLLFRVVMIPEFATVISWLEWHENLGFDFPIAKYPSLITRYIFHKNPFAIGISPSFLGFFLIVFGWIGFFIGLCFTFLVSNLLTLLKYGGLFSILLYFIWSIEFISFFTDGIPHFYTSTSNGLFFWALIILTGYIFTKKVIHES